jgi:translocation and assembly module TamB
MAKWQKIVGWTAVTIGALLLLVIVAAIVLLHTPAFRNYLLAKIEQKAGEATGARVEIQDFDVHVGSLTADIYGLTIHGKEAAAEKPLLQVQHVKVGVKIISVLNRKVNLSELMIERPVVNLIVDKQGNSNLPHPPPSENKNSSTNVFDLAVGHVLLTNGEIDARDRRIPMEANLANLRTEITFSQLQKRYSGTFSYDDGRIQYAQLRPLAHSLRASFDATPSELNLKPLVLKLGGSRISLRASVKNYSTTPFATGSYDVLLHTQDFSGLLSAAQASGDVALRGNLKYQDVPGRSILRNAGLSGDIGSNGLTLSSPQAKIKLYRIAGKYQLTNGNFKADPFVVDLLGGQLTANGSVEQVDTARKSHLHLELAGVSLPALKSSLTRFSQHSVPVTGTLNAKGDARWQGALEKLYADSALTMRGSLIGAGSGRAQRFPLSADIHVDYNGPRQLLRVASSSIQLPGTSIHAQGQVGGRSNLSINASTRDIHQLLALASAMSSSATPNSEAGYGEVYGTATVNAAVRGSLQNPQIRAQVSASKLQVNQSEWNSLKLALTANPSQLAIQNGSLVSARQGQIGLSGSVGLRHWSYVPTEPVAANVQIQRLTIAELQDAANTKYPLEGQIYGDLQFRGSPLDPQGQGKLNISKAVISDEPLKTISAQFHAENGVIHSDLTTGGVKATVSYTPKTEAYTLELSAPQIDISKSHTVQAKNLPVKGLVTIKANGKGTLSNPQLTASVQVDQLQLQNSSFSRVDADLNIANHLAKLALNSGVSGASLRGNATVHLSPGYYTQAALDTSKFDIDPFLAMYMPSRPAGLHGETEIHVSVRGPAADTAKLEAHLTIPILDASYQSLQFAATGPIRVDYSNSVLVLHPASIKGTQTSLQFQGRIPLNSPAAMAVSAHGSVGLQLVQMFSPALRTGGDIALDVNAGGTLNKPAVNGQVRLQNVSLSSEAMPLGVQSLNALMQINDTSLQITNGSGKLGGGDITLGGSIIYRPKLQMNVAVSAKSVRVRYPEGVRTVFDSDLTLSGDRQASLLQGRVLIDSLSFTSDFDIGSLMSQFTGTSAPPTAESIADTMKLQIAVQSTNQLSAGTAQLGVEGTANLRVVGTASDPVVTGRADLASGDIFFGKNQYHLERGIITFANPNRTEPVLNLLITTTISQYSLSISIRGPIQKLQTSYVSDPPLSPIDIINLVARGSTTTGGGSNTSTTDQVLAAGLGGVGSEVSKLTGIAGLQIDPLIGGENSDPSARIGIQKRVTKNFLFTFSTDVTQPQSEIVQGEYQITKRWSISVLRDESGGFAVDGKFHTKF